MTIRTVTAASLPAALPALRRLLVDSVAHGASVGFLHPLSAEEADRYWAGVARAVTDGRTVLLVAESPQDGVVGTVQVVLAAMPNQPHRAEISKLLVHSGARRRGVGEALMRAAEARADALGRWLLVLDTATAAADRLYVRLGWKAAGDIPDYALNADGTLTHTRLYYKRLSAAPPRVPR